MKRRLKRLILALSGLALLLLVAVILIDWHVSAIGATRLLAFDKLAQQEPYDCVIVPGALVHEDGTPSGILQDRLDMAVKIYNSGVTNKILVSGDHGRPEYNEVGVMRQYLLDAGIPAEDIFMDHAGFDTFDTVFRAQSVFCVKRALITTQDFHLSRALYIGVELGYELDGVDCGYVVFNEDLKYRLREYPARLKAFLDCEVFQSLPSFSGPTIPISGDGQATLD